MQTSARRATLKSLNGITAVIGFAASLLFLAAAPANAASAVDEAQAVFQTFVTAQNAPDAATVESKLWNSGFQRP